jgi:spermidine synthase
VTYEAAFGKFFNLKRDNRVIVTQLAALPDAARLRTTAQQFADAFYTFGFSATELLPLFTQERDWDLRARVLTDQYSPANLLNLER